MTRGFWWRWVTVLFLLLSLLRLLFGNGVLNQWGLWW